MTATPHVLKKSPRAMLNMSITATYEYTCGDQFNYHLHKCAGNLPSKSPMLKDDQDQQIVKHQ